MKKRGLYIFDCDGVVREFSMQRIYEFYIEVCKAFNVGFCRLFPTYEAFLQWYSHDWKYNMRRLGIVSEEDIAHTGVMFTEIYEPQINVFPWVHEFFQKLSVDHHIAICSNSSTSSVERSLNGVAQYIHMIVGHDRMKKLKPHPDGLFTIMTQLGHEPQDTAFLGDSSADIGAGCEAGVLTGAVAWGATETHEELVALGADMILQKPEDLLCLI